MVTKFTIKYKHLLDVKVIENLHLCSLSKLLSRKAIGESAASNIICYAKILQLQNTFPNKIIFTVSRNLSKTLPSIFEKIKST